MNTNDNATVKLEAWVEQFIALLTIRRVVICLLAVLFFIAWNRGIALIYGLFFFLLAVLIVSYVVSFFLVTPLMVHRQHPSIGYEGQLMTINYMVINKGKVARNMLEVFDYLPFVDQAHQQAMLFFPKVAEPTSLSLTALCDWRGVHTLGSMKIESGWPFGLFRSKKIIGDSDSSILIYPSTFTIQQLPFLGTSTFQHDGWTSDNRKGGQDLFLGIRDYRRGDSLKHIHWGLSAKHNTLVVKEYENISRTEVCILLNLHADDNPGEGKHTPLEYAIKIAASVAEFALKEGHFVSLYGLGEKYLELEAGGGPAWFDPILYSLALVKADGHEPYETLIEQQQHNHTNQCVFLLFDHHGFELQASSLGINPQQVMMVRFDQKTFEQMLPTQHQSLIDGSLLIQCGDDIAARVQAWTQR